MLWPSAVRPCVCPSVCLSATSRCSIKNTKRMITETTPYDSKDKPGIQREQALADISRSALSCHSNDTRAPLANPPNSAQLEALPFPNLHPCPCSNVGMRLGTDRHADERARIHFASAMPHAKCNETRLESPQRGRQTRVYV